MTTPGIPLLEVQPDLAHGIPDDEVELARQVIVAPLVKLGRGPWRPEDHAAGAQGPFSMLVIDGLVTRSTAIADRTATELFGPDDLIPATTRVDGLVPAVVEWSANAPSRLAVLDGRLLVAARRWPTIMRNLHIRAAAQASRLAVHAAIAQLPRVKTRVLAILWHLADRFGRMTGDGVVVPIRLTHEALGRLVGSQRPTVTLALRDLSTQGVLERRGDGSWLLRDGSQVDLEPALRR